MRISTSTLYALRALVRLAQLPHNHLVSSRTIAQECRLPERFLLQIMSRMTKRGLVRSVRGATGGYRLLHSPDNISLLDITIAIDGELTDDRLDDLPLDARETIRAVMDAIVGQQKEALSALRLSDFTSLSPGEPGKETRAEAPHSGEHHSDDEATLLETIDGDADESSTDERTSSL